VISSGSQEGDNDVDDGGIPAWASKQYPVSVPQEPSNHRTTKVQRDSVQRARQPEVQVWTLEKYDWRTWGRSSCQQNVPFVVRSSQAHVSLVVGFASKILDI
jgi:hypothetical protein